MTIGCQDCAGITKVAEAGRTIETPAGAVQIMHNGIKVRAGGYHGDWMAQVIRALQGHHEPQEELVFHHMLKYVRHNSLIVELGAFWAYYTLWYLHEIPGASAICVEPDPANLSVGRQNAALNELESRIEFHQAWVGGQYLDHLEMPCESTGAVQGLPCLDFEAILRLAGDRVIEVLHMDVQGQELPFAKTMQAAADGTVRFVVMSTHHSSISGSTTTHTDCLAILNQVGATILAQHDVQQSYSGDGLIVASFFREDAGIRLPHMSLNDARSSLFPTR